MISDVSLVLKQVNTFFSMRAHLYDDTAVTAVEPEDMTELVEVLIERDTEFAAFFCGSLFEFVHFLMDSGRWSGTPESYQAVRRILLDGLFSARFLPQGRPGRQAGSSRQVPRKSA